MPGCAAAQNATTYTVGTETIAAGTRQPVGYERLGIKAGDFTISPEVNQALAYDSNVNASSVNGRADGYYSISPSVLVRSNWSRHKLDLRGNYSAYRYFSIPINDYTQYKAGLDGRLDISSTTQLTALGSIGKAVEPRGTEGDTFLNGPPVSYRLTSGEGALMQELGRIQVQLSGDYVQYHYNKRVVAGAPIDLSFRNNSSYSEDARINYGLSPSVSLFVDGSLNQSDYSVELAGIDRNSHGLQALGGVTFALTSLITGEIGAGYLEQTFKSPLFPRVSGLDYRAQLAWNVTTLSTLTIHAARSIERSPLAGVAGIVSSNFGFVVDHELLRNVLLRGGFVYTSNSYTGVTQVNHRIGLNASARYLVNRNITLALTDNFSHQTQSGVVVSGRSYSRNQILLSLALGL